MELKRLKQIMGKEKNVFMLLTLWSASFIHIIPQNFLQVIVPLVVVLSPLVIYGFYEECRQSLSLRQWVYLQVGYLILVLAVSLIYILL